MAQDPGRTVGVQDAGSCADNKKQHGNRVTRRGPERWLREMSPHQYTYPKVTPLPTTATRPASTSQTGPAAPGSGSTSR